MPAKKIHPSRKAKVAEPRDTPISFRVKPSLKKALENAAAADRRSMSQLIILELEDAMKSKGYLK
jgi:predicted HicB family RNase H-like nuclease